MKLNNMTIGRKAAAAMLMIFIFFAAGECFILYIKAQKTIKQHVNNEIIFNDSIRYFKDKEGREAARVGTLELSVKELNKILPGVTEELKNLRINPRKVETITKTVTAQNKEIKQYLKDSILITRDTLKVFNYSDAWYKIRGQIKGDTAQISIKSTDTLIQVISRTGPRLNPYLWIFSRRTLQQTIQSRNPNNKIIYSQNIKIKK